jgi:hypothetical protein
VSSVQCEGVQTLVWQGSKASALYDCFLNKISNQCSVLSEQCEGVQTLVWQGSKASALYDCFLPKNGNSNVRHLC